MSSVYAVRIDGNVVAGFEVSCMQHGTLHFHVRQNKLLMALEEMRSHVDNHLQRVRHNEEGIV